MIIRLNDLRVSTIIGVYDFEKKQERELVMNLEIETNAYKQGSDNIADTLDYDGLAKLLKEETKKNNFNLIEKLATHLLEKLKEMPQIISAKLEIEKPACVKDVRSVSVVVGF